MRFGRRVVPGAFFGTIAALVNYSAPTASADNANGADLGFFTEWIPCLPETCV